MYQTYDQAAVGQAGNPAFQIALAQLDVANAMPNVHIATPIYFISAPNGGHLNTSGSKWMGAYYGLDYKRVVINGDNSTRLEPIAFTVSSNTVNVQFSLGKTPLRINTTYTPTNTAQSNYGFSMTDASGNPVSTTVTLAGPDRVVISAATPIVSGFTLNYGALSLGGEHQRQRRQLLHHYRHRRRDPAFGQLAQNLLAHLLTSV